MFGIFGLWPEFFDSSWNSGQMTWAIWIISTKDLVWIGGGVGEDGVWAILFLWLVNGHKVKKNASLFMVLFDKSAYLFLLGF